MMMGDDALLFNQSNIPRKAHTLNREKMTADELNDQEDTAEVNELNNETNLPRTTETNAAPFETSFPPDAADRNLGAMEGSNETPYEPPRATDADSNLRVMEGSNKTPYEPPSHVAKMDHDEAPTYTLLTDGSQFQQSFWETEVQSLQDGLRRNFAGKANTPSRRIPTADELQIQFVTWLLEQPEVPLLVSPASSGFYEATYGNRPTPTAGTGFFDDEYVAGKRQHTISRDRQRNTLNPGLRTELTYQEACTAELTTIASVEHHERRLFQPGFTPTEIRGNILSMLQTANPDQHMVDFQEKDIPPQNRDPKTHRILMDLIRKRRQLDLDFQLPPHSVAVDGTSLHDKRQYEQELIRRDREYNRVNRGMYHVYAASAYIVHDCNFLSYCRPALRNLPIATAYKLAQLKERLVTPNSGHPPYQTIQEPTRVQTQPTFSAPRPSYADVLRPALHPREEWMKSQPPYMSDEEADRVWTQSNSAAFPKGALTDSELQNQIDILKKIQEHRLQTAPPKNQFAAHNDDLPSSGATAAWRQPVMKGMASRLFRQGIKTNLSVKKPKHTSTQSESSISPSYGAEAVLGSQNKNCPKKTPSPDQSKSDSSVSFSKQNENVEEIDNTGWKTSNGPRRQLGNHPRAVARQHDMQSSAHVLAPFDKATANAQRSREKARQGLAKRDKRKTCNDLDEPPLTVEEELMFHNFANAEDKTEATIAAKPVSARPVSSRRKTSSNEFGGGTFWNRPAATKRKPNPTPDVLAVSSPPPPRQHDLIAATNPDVLAASSAPPSTHDLIVDTGASHVLFQYKHIDLLAHVVLSRPDQQPFAVLRAANGQILTAIGKGIFQVKHISVVAYIFKDADLVHNLLGIAPFADCGCKAVFTAQEFNLYHNKVLILHGRRHSANLWHINLDRTVKTICLAHLHPPASDPVLPVLLLHEDTRKNAKYVQFVHACMGSPPPITFLSAIQRGYLAGKEQFPRLTAKMVRHNMPNSEATARGHHMKN